MKTMKRGETKYALSNVSQKQSQLKTQTILKMIENVAGIERARERMRSIRMRIKTCALIKGERRKTEISRVNEHQQNHWNTNQCRNIIIVLSILLYLFLSLCWFSLYYFVCLNSKQFAKSRTYCKWNSDIQLACVCVCLNR